jgi:hypothetical protein
MNAGNEIPGPTDSGEMPSGSGGRALGLQA